MFGFANVITRCDRPNARILRGRSENGNVHSSVAEKYTSSTAQLNLFINRGGDANEH